MSRIGRVGFLVAAALAVAGCSQTRLIPNTKIEDTVTNREVLKVVEAYRRAMEHRDAAKILTLAHPSYRDESGTPEPVDDIDYGGLRKLLSSRFKLVQRIRYRIDYQSLEIRGREVHVDTWIDATFVYNHPGAKPRYQRYTDYHRYRLLRDAKVWRFIGGL